jgi:hypothetical protein
LDNGRRNDAKQQEAVKWIQRYQKRVNQSTLHVHPRSPMFLFSLNAKDGKQKKHVQTWVNTVTQLDSNVNKEVTQLITSNAACSTTN